MNKRGLGRGLGALLSSTPTESEGEESLIDVPIDKIEVNPNQPRKVFDFTALDELAASIRASGVIQPIIVRRYGDGYQLIAGERRWRAARQAGLERIPAIVRAATEASSRVTETVAVTKGLTLRRGRRRYVELESLEEALQRGLMTRVRIIGNERRGKIMVTYATPDELERLSEIFGARH